MDATKPYKVIGSRGGGSRPLLSAIESDILDCEGPNEPSRRGNNAGPPPAARLWTGFIDKSAHAGFGLQKGQRRSSSYGARAARGLS